MAILTSFWIVDIGLFLVSALALTYLYFLRQYSFWKKHGIKHIKPVFPFGNTKGMGTEKLFGDIFKELYFEHKHEPIMGMWIFSKPVLLANDPEILKRIFVKDFSSYQDRGIVYHEEFDPLSAHLLNIKGSKWRNLRTKISPIFTSGKMKMMFSLLVDCSEILKKVLTESANKGELVDMKEIAARFTTDVISSVSLGLETNSLQNPDALYRTMGRKAVEPNTRNLLAGLLATITPTLAKILRIPMVPPEVSEFFTDSVRETMDYREKNKVKRNDFMQLMIELKNKGHVDGVDAKANGEKQSEPFTFNNAVAEVFLFFAAGFETSSTTMQFTLYELALNPDIQERAREEVLKVLSEHDGKITYEAIYEMNYLGRILDETLRKYPPVVVLQRETNREVELGGKIIPSGVLIQIPVFGIHRDPEFYPNPDKYDPDRFLEEEKAKRPHFTYLPFGEGPRACIGLRFGLMQNRVGLSVILSNFKIEVCKETPIPVAFDKKGFLLSPLGGMPLKLTLLKK